ncbi:hypothetical protein OpiT1DRAFT_03302 [Opitutaceae bacterium TAV1]|nr:hypothetical protein OpiT1DRAFT_03302 [Opitutaceae bacterium TAV1]
MKKLSFIIVLCMLFLSARGETNVFPLSGNVGIGTTNPNTLLEVNRISANDANYAYPAGTWAARILNRIDAPSENGLVVGNRWNAAVSTIFAAGNMLNNSGNFKTYFLINGIGQVGVGTLVPKERLQIGNMITFHDGGSKAISFNRYWSADRWRTIEAGYSSSILWDTYSGALRMYMNPNLGANEEAPQVEKFAILNNGNVGIGVSWPSHALTVNGPIRAKEIIVDTGWADDVFAEDYALMPLAEVKHHIEANKRLPGVPSAGEVASEGVSVGEMQSLLLRKIEELTLHVIRQQEEIDGLHRKLETRSASGEVDAK